MPGMPDTTDIDTPVDTPVDTAAINAAVDKARLRVALLWPQLADGVWALRGPIIAPGLAENAGGIAACDKDWRLYVDPCIAAATTAQIATALVHEAWHCLRDHGAQLLTADIPAQMLRAAQCAVDCEVNGDMERCAPAPAWPYRVWQPGDLGLNEGLPWEDYYAAIRAGAPGGDCPPDRPGGSSTDGRQRVWELPRAADVPGVPVHQQGLVRDAVARAIDRDPGNLAGGARRWAGVRLAAPSVPWQHILASEVRAGMTAVAGATDYSRLKPSRRQAVTPVVLASLVQPAVTVDVVVDTSGSMDDAALRTVLSETEGIVRSAGAAVRLYACDAEVHGGVQRVRHAAEAKLCGGGGTDMMKGIRFAAAQRPRADILVVLTDGYTWGGWSAERPSFTRVIIALVGTGHAGLKSLPAWARGLEIRGQEGREP